MAIQPESVRGIIDKYFTKVVGMSATLRAIEKAQRNQVAVVQVHGKDSQDIPLLSSADTIAASIESPSKSPLMVNEEGLIRSPTEERLSQSPRLVYDTCQDDIPVAISLSATKVAKPGKRKCMASKVSHGTSINPPGKKSRNTKARPVPPASRTTRDKRKKVLPCDKGGQKTIDTDKVLSDSFVLDKLERLAGLLDGIHRRLCALEGLYKDKLEKIVDLFEAPTSPRHSSGGPR